MSAVQRPLPRSSSPLPSSYRHPRACERHVGLQGVAEVLPRNNVQHLSRQRGGESSMSLRSRRFVYLVGFVGRPSRSVLGLSSSLDKNKGRRSGSRSGPEPHELRVHAVSAKEGTVHDGTNDHDGEQVWYVQSTVFCAEIGSRLPLFGELTTSHGCTCFALQSSTGTTKQHAGKQMFPVASTRTVVVRRASTQRNGVHEGLGSAVVLVPARTHLVQLVRGICKRLSRQHRRNVSALPIHASSRVKFT
jgi:hypothetical protein